MPRKMKESGVEWLGQIPEGWGVCRCKFILCRNDGGIWGNDPVGEDGEFVLRSTEQTIDGNWEVIAPAKRDLSVIPNKEYFLIRAGDLLVTKSSGSDLHIGKTTLADEAIEKGHYYYSNFLQRLRFDGSTAPRFVWYLMNSCIARQQFVYRQNSTSGIGNINAADIDELKFPRPPLPDQQRIAAFLDERCAKIDGMIAEAKTSIEDYNIYRQDVIDCLANFGSCSIDRVKVRDSGNVWLNKVPDAWDVLKIGLIFKENCRAPKDEDIPLSLSQKDGLIPTDLMQEHSLKTSTYENWKRVLPDDLVLNRFKAHLGVFYASQYTGMVSFHYGVFVARRPLSVKYYEYLFHSTPYRRMFAEFSNGITVGLQNLSNSSFYSARCVCPPVDVQRRIAAELDEKCAAIDKLVGEKEALIADLEAYKKSLIFETVTGKREVA